MNDNDVESSNRSPGCKRSLSSSSIHGDSIISSSGSKVDDPLCSVEELHYILFIGSSAIIGACVRVYLSRLFGEDCEEGIDSVQDFLTPLSKNICVTAGGRTIQTGGALFRDLPANILGSFIMGLLTSHRHSLRFPWFHKNHPLQQHDVLHTGLGVGLCGCLTTFASWNTQMVVMMDGTHTEVGSQVIAALVGYVLGLAGSISSFKFGREVSYWMYAWVHRMELEAEENHSSLAEQGHLPTVGSRNRFACGVRPLILFPLCAIALFSVMLVGDYVYGISFYQDMWTMIILAPFGALCRWKLAYWNKPDTPKWHKNHLPWVPMGTLTANLVGALVSIACQGILDRYSGVGLLDNEWTLAVFFAVKVGFAGSLSTVSSMVKEVVAMEEKYPGQAKPFLYGLCTCGGGLALGLLVYMTIVRINA